MALSGSGWEVFTRIPSSSHYVIWCEREFVLSGNRRYNVTIFCNQLIDKFWLILYLQMAHTEITLELKTILLAVFSI